MESRYKIKYQVLDKWVQFDNGTPYPLESLNQIIPLIAQRERGKTISLIEIEEA